MSGRPLVDLLVERGLAADIRLARSLIMQGRVLVNERRETAVGKRVPEDSAITLREEALPYVSRGALKLRHCLEALGADAPALAGAVCLDVGAGSGGFTQVLLEEGAARVFAVDVGRVLKDAKLREDPRVILLEGVNARDLNADLVPQAIDAFTLDVSFISGASLLGGVKPLCSPNACGLFLAKPQFEREPDPADEKTGAFADGVVRSRDLLVRTLVDVHRRVADSGFAVKRVLTAYPRGTRGNYEFFFLLTLAGGRMSKDEFAREVNALLESLPLS